MTDQRIDMGSDESVAWALHRELAILPVVLRMVYEGDPVSKARARINTRGSKPRTYTPQKTQTAEQRIAILARQAGLRGEADAEHTFGIFAKFFCATWQRRDVDNMLKLVADALTGVAWADDSQVSEMSASVQRGVEDPRTHLLIYRTPAAMPPTVPCGICGTPVRQYKSVQGKFCSRECSGVSQQKRVDLTCAQCGQVYQLPANRAARIKTPYCSEGCRGLAQRVEGPCATCGMHVSKPKSWAGRTLSCSKRCADAHKIGRPRGGVAAPAAAACQLCGKPVTKAMATHDAEANSEWGTADGSACIYGYMHQVAA